MRITPDLLIKVARDTVQQRTNSDRDILAVYLHGSVLSNEPLLGGTADIDLFFIYNNNRPEEREIVRMTDDIHLDITHLARSIFRQARELRLHPWLGPTIYECKILFDPQHFMDFTQASVRSQFKNPENTMARARLQAEHARQMWLSLQMGTTAQELEGARTYLRAVEHAANAIASLTGAPLPERRFVLGFRARAEAVQHSGLYQGLVGLLGGQAADVETLRTWLPKWRTAFEAISKGQPPARLHPYRLNYYLHCFQAILESQHPQDLLWPLLHTWSLMAKILPPDSPLQADWQEAGSHLGLLGPAFSERIAGLDAYLDTIEETLDTWARQNGVL
jgi:hypothetical protein